MAHPVQKPNEHYTYRDLLTWPESERWELIHGVPYNMTPAPSPEHQAISLDLATQFNIFLQGKPCRAYTSQIDVLLPTGNEDDSAVDVVVQPDIIIVCNRAKIKDNYIKGAPDLAVEILSPSSGQRDLTEKMNLYEQAGVPEYWIVDPTHRTIMVFRLGENGSYGRPATYTETDQIPVGILEGLTIDLQRVFTGEA